MSNAPNLQQKFNDEYITSSEIIETLEISRAAFLYARVRGKMPEAPIVVNRGRLLIWLRSDVESLIKSWKQEIILRKAA